jgi:glycosyltransferase involved in cell wall biosynthesis
MPESIPISIIMPVFNAGPYLEECLDSILNQDYPNWELIAIDDYSTDNSKEILEMYAQKDARIQWMPNKKKGIIPALRIAFSQTIHPLITRMDADDIMPINKLKILSQKLLESGEKHVSTGKVSYFSAKTLGKGYLKYEQWINSMVDHENHFDHIFQECVIPSACWLAFKKDLLQIEAFRESEYPEDYDLVFRLYKGGFKICSSKEILHLWRDHPERASRNDSNYADQNFFHLKVKYFIDLKYNPDKTLFLWGAGTKGKHVARLFIDRKIPFCWVSNNEKKIGKDIYGKIIDSPELMISKDKKLVVTAIADLRFESEKDALFIQYSINENDLVQF